MRERGQALLPTVLALTLVALLVNSMAAMAASGLPSTITMTPETAGPGATVEVTGVDFPTNAAVELQLSSADGTVYVGTATTTDGGYFREVLTLPVGAPAGSAQLRAAASDGSNATLAFAVAATDAAVPETVAAAPSGNSLADIVVMIIIAVLIAAVGGGIAYVWQQSKIGDEQPGMSAGADPIWGGQAGDDAPGPAAAATDEPIWNTAPSDSST